MVRPAAAHTAGLGTSDGVGSAARPTRRAPAAARRARWSRRATVAPRPPRLGAPVGTPGRPDAARPTGAFRAGCARVASG
jgi:hypothetical protein